MGSLLFGLLVFIFLGVAVTFDFYLYNPKNSYFLYYNDKIGQIFYEMRIILHK